MKNISGEMERITKLDIRPQHMFVRTLRILMVTILAGTAATLSMSTMVAPVTTTITSGSSTPVATPTIHQGDTVNIEATLSTTDPNENGEGEPLLILSGGGFSATISTYEQSLPFSFVSPVDGVTLSAFIQGYDGDESATLRRTTASRVRGKIRSRSHFQAVSTLRVCWVEEISRSKRKTAMTPNRT